MIDWNKRRKPAAEEARDLARAYLAATDWYVIRAAETKKPVPKDVAAKRKAARELANG